MYELDNNGHETWCTHVRSLLDSIALRDVWDTQNIPPDFQNIEHLKSKFNTALDDKFIRGWTCQINNRNENPILRTYAKFKSNFKTEPYLTSLRVKRNQMNIARFRVSSHQLAIEKGHHQLPVIPPHERLCHYCTKGKVDDELHFLLQCDFNEQDRRSFFNSISGYQDNVYAVDENELFKSIMGSHVPQVLFALGKFISEGFKKRKLH